jgi:small GTP-binding protein
MPMPHRTFAQLAKRRLVGKEGRERVREVNALLAELPDYRNGPYADLRKWLLSEIEESRVRSNAVHRDSIEVRREGAAQIALVGPPNVGKSSILQALSEIQIKTGDYPFTTLRPIPALTRIGGVLVQLVEIPGLIEGATDDRGGGRALLGVLRSADAIVYCARADADPAELRSVRAEVTLAGIDKPAVLAATRADEAAPRDDRTARGRVSGPRRRPGLGDRRGEPRGVPRGRVAPDRPDPGAAPDRRAGRSGASSRSIPAPPSRTSPTGSTTTSGRRSSVPASGDRRPASTASAWVAIMPSSTATTWRSSADVRPTGSSGGTLDAPVRSQVLSAGGRHGDERAVARLVMALDEAQDRWRLPDRQARARRSPRFERLGVGALARSDPLEEVKDQVVDGLRHVRQDARRSAATAMAN